MHFFSKPSHLARIALLLAVMFVAAESIASEHVHLFDHEHAIDCDTCLQLHADASLLPVLDPIWNTGKASGKVLLSGGALRQKFFLRPYNRGPPLAI